jgi:hypothetical protein
MVAFTALGKSIGVEKLIILCLFFKLVGLAKKHVTTIQRCNITINCINERSN